MGNMMINAKTAATPALLPAGGSTAAIRCERAAAELRYGRPVLIRGNDGATLAALALDAADRAAYEAFGAALGDRHDLFLTPTRAAVLGLTAPTGALLPLGGIGFAEACHLGYLRGAFRLRDWREGGPLESEAALAARLALLLPAVVCGRVTADNPAFADAVSLELGDLDAANLANLGRFEVVARTEVPLKGIESAEFVIFRGGLAQRDQVAIVVGDPDRSRPVPVRVHSSCITGDLFGSLKCDCGDQLRGGLKTLEERGGGVLIYLDQEGRGTGIAAKMRAYGMQGEGLDTIDADAQLGFGADERRYEAAAAMLSGLDINRVDLLTNNPLKVAYLRACGIDVVSRTPVLGPLTAQNTGYLRTKSRRGGHMLDQLFEG